MDRLAYFIAHMAGASIAGAALIVFFIFGWYSWWAVATAGIIGLLMAWPVGKLISVRIKKDDPNWTYSGGMGIVPDPKAPEL